MLYLLQSIIGTAVGVLRGTLGGVANDPSVSPGAGGMTILNSSGTSFSVSLNILNSSGTSFTVSNIILDSDGNPFVVI